MKAFMLFKSFNFGFVGKKEGFSLLSTLIFSGVLTTVMLSVMSSIQQQNKSIKGLSDKLSLENLEVQLSQMLQVNDYCSCLMRGSVLNTSTRLLSQTKVVLPSSYQLPIPSSLGTSCLESVGRIIPSRGEKLLDGEFTVKNVEYGPSTQTSSGQYETFINISLEPNSGQQLRPVQVPITFGVLSSDPPNAKRFAYCGKSATESTPTIMRSGWMSYTPTETGLYHVEFIGSMRANREGESYIWMLMNGGRNPMYATESRCGQRDAKSGGNTWLSCPFHMTEFWIMSAGVTYNFGYGGSFPGGGGLLGGGASEAVWIVSKESL